MKSRSGHKKHHHHLFQNQRDEENSKEQFDHDTEIAANSKALKEKQEEEYHNTHWNHQFNKFDGLYYNDDGTRVNWGDKKAVGGVNNYSKNNQRHYNKKHQRSHMMAQEEPESISRNDQSMEEQEKHEKEINAAVQESKAFSKK
jgi:hypothetical protein